MRVAVTFRNEARVGPYLDALKEAEAGIESALNPESLDSLDGLLLTGGSDINPARYGRENAGSDEVDDSRDEREIRLFRQALDADLPVLAICRGLQLVNVACGGTLVQHLSSTNVHRQRPPKNAKPGEHPAAHRIWVAPKTRLAEIIGGGGHDVNSRHHQAVEGLGQGLMVSAISEDGVIEGLEYKAASFAVAVQWHPEDRIRVSAADRKLFEAFASAVISSPDGCRATRRPNS